MTNFDLDATNWAHHVCTAVNAVRHVDSFGNNL